MSKICWIICLICIFLTAGCGRVSAPKSPDNAFYPHTYFIQEETTLKNKTPDEPIDEELKDTGMIIEKVY
jgi:hypothetical protein